jgi:hypothetical protein
MDPQQIMQQQFAGPVPVSTNTTNRTPTTNSAKYNTQNEPETTTNYTWLQIKKWKRSNQTPETTTVGNPFLFNTQNRHEELSSLSDEDMQTNKTDETATNTKNKQPRESKPPPIYIYIYTRSNKLP